MFGVQRVEVRVMRKAEAVLEIISDRGKKGLHLEEVYRQLYNPDLYLRAYGRLYRNDGAMTPGVTAETVDAKQEEAGLGVRNEFPLTRRCKSVPNQTANNADGTLKPAAGIALVGATR